MTRAGASLLGPLPTVQAGAPPKRAPAMVR